jgi:hypothetical protein
MQPAQELNAIWLKLGPVCFRKLEGARAVAFLMTTATGLMWLLEFENVIPPYLKLPQTL